jgi:hypothetical protein
MKYELTDETINVSGVTLRRIKYLASGQPGGWLESEKNLSQCGDACVSGDACVYGDARVFENARVHGDARVFENARVHGDARVFENARVHGGSWEVSPLQIQGSRFFFSVSSEASVAIGCQDKTVDEWLSSYSQDFEEYNFTEKERVEYKRYFDLAAELYGWEVPLFRTDTA